MSSLSWWFAPHPAWEPGEDWPQDVPVVRYETDAEIALIDPLLPSDDSFDSHGKPATLVSGDVLTGRDGVMHVFVDEADREALLDSLDRIAGLPVERVIVPHCETAVFTDASTHIRAAVAEARQAS